MVKSYLRYEHALFFGAIASVDSNISHDSTSRYLLTAALDKIAAWDLRKGVAFKTLSPSPQPSHTLAVTSIAAHPSALASGHADGSGRLWDFAKGVCEAMLNGHKSAVTELRYNENASLLLSGSKDCDIILWDVVAEAGLVRLRGHRDQVTDLAFFDSGKKLVSCSKDKFVRVWDLEMQHCMQIVSGHQSEIWSLDIDHEERFLVTDSADRELRFYEIKHALEEPDSSSKWEVLKQFGEISRLSEDRMENLRFNKSGSLLACQAAGKTVEIY